jgi:hypothetical protein
MIKYHGKVDIPATVLLEAEKIKLLNYKTTTPTRFKKNTLTEDIAKDLMVDIANKIEYFPSRLDYVYFSVCKGAEPHTDNLSPMDFLDKTFVIPVILPSGWSIIKAENDMRIVEVGGIYEFNHTKIHSMELEDTESGCVVIMVAINRWWS